jgi:hypothetical protein
METEGGEDGGDGTKDREGRGEAATASDTGLYMAGLKDGRSVGRWRLGASVKE